MLATDMNYQSCVPTKVVCKNASGGDKLRSCMLTQIARANMFYIVNKRETNSTRKVVFYTSCCRQKQSQFDVAPSY